jgi:hypothetical protein|tara:strand:+ start:2256 stop:2615 length:360 start_codon:yes stop_codon:yes gene_type:complete
MYKRQLIDRPDTSKIKNFDRLVVELSKYMSELEMDQAIAFMETIRDSKFDVNPSVEDSATQLKIMLGSERYRELKLLWAKDNQHLLQNLGNKKYLGQDGIYYDGLDPTDNPNDFKEIYI